PISAQIATRLALSRTSAFEKCLGTNRMGNGYAQTYDFFTTRIRTSDEETRGDGRWPMTSGFV
ncbi:MAG: hypothetical protein KBI41_11975, partial [Kiritimatiellae bacterium]|nr:hypothetical protein [Kiritimatiellia bacterium]